MARPILNSAVTRPGAVLSWLGLLYSETEHPVTALGKQCVSIQMLAL